MARLENGDHELDFCVSFKRRIVTKCLISELKIASHDHDLPKVDSGLN